MIQFENVVKSFRTITAADHLSFQIKDGQRIVLYGPSGAGKSTVLKLIAGLQQPDAGEITNTSHPISLVFQQDHLFDELTCLENIMYGLPANLYSRKEREQKAIKWARTFHCQQYLQQKASTLSGGQRQRAALARAFMKDPQLVLLDESFNALDVSLKEELISAVLKQQQKSRFTLVSITHDLQEAARLGELIFVMREGRIVQKGPMSSLFSKPADLFEAHAFGSFEYNILPASHFGKRGWAAIRSWDIGKEEASGCICLDVIFLYEEDLKYCLLQTYQFQSELIRILTKTSSRVDRLYVNPEHLIYFSEDGARV